MGWVAYRFEAAFALARRAGRAVAVIIPLSLVAVAPHPSAAQTVPDPAAPQVQVQINQTFVLQGPSPEFGNFVDMGTADATPNGTDAGAVQAVLPDSQLGAATMFAGSPNGGIWVTTNNGATWKPLTDNQAALSISSLSLDPKDTSGKTIIAGIGNTSSSLLGSSNNGLLYSTNGGTSWSALGQSAFGGQSVISALARGPTILAATFEMNNPGGATAGYGLYRSIDGGATFMNVSGVAGSGLPVGAVTSLVGDPSNPQTLYAAVKNAADNGLTAVYVSRNAGATWAPIFTGAQSGGLISSVGDGTVITLTTGRNGSVAFTVVDLGHAGQPESVTGAYLSQDGGSSWHQLDVSPNNTVPNVSQGAQGPGKVHIAIDPNNANIVYISGDGYNNNTESGIVDRLTYNPTTQKTTFASLTFEGTGGAVNFQDANTLHADTRSLSFDQNGNLIVSSDGGIYIRTNPSGTGGVPGSWSGLNGNLSVFEGYSVAYDANSKRVAIAAQDNGSALQHMPGSAQFDGINGGDGTNVAINDRTLTGLSAIYTTTAGLEFPSRLIINSQGQVVEPQPYDPINTPNGIAITCSLGLLVNRDCGHLTNATSASGNFNAFSAQFVLNTIDPTLIAMTGGTHAYVTQDPLAQNVAATSIDLTLTDLGPTHGLPNAVSYGTRDNLYAVAIASGGDNGSIWLSTTSGTGSLVEVASQLGTAQAGVFVVFDTRTQSRIFAANNSNLYYIQNANTAPTVTTINVGQLVPGFINPTSVQFISNNGVNALLVGGMNAPLASACTLGTPNGCVISPSQSPITVADSDSSGNLSGWRAFGQGLPNALVYNMAYNPTVDVLAASSFGRGVSVLYDVTSYFKQAIQLWFGLANNDSIPDATYLTNGNYASRQLIKYGAGTLTIAGDATYTGGTTISAGTLVLGTGGTSGSVKGNIAFSDPSTIPSDPNCNLASACDPSTNKVLAFNRSDAYTFSGSITGPGQVKQEGPGTTVLSGANTYTGSTTVDVGTLAVTGSITSAVLVNAGGVLAGSGTVGSTTINAGGLLAPANPGGALTVQGNLVFATAGAYLVEINNNLSDRVNVTGSAALAGNVDVALLGTSVSKQYTILNATGGTAGTFAGVNNLPTALAGNLGYEGTSVSLNLSLNYNALGSLNSNQQNVASVLTNFFNANGSIPVGFATLTQAGLSQVAGESATGSEQTTFQAMTQFITTLLDPFISGRENPQGTPGANGYAEEDTGASAYAASGKALSQNKALTQNERAAYAAVFTKAPLRQVYDPHWSVWASAFGGSQTTDGNAALGANGTTSSIAGGAVGTDYLFSPNTIAGIALAGGGTSFSVTNAGSGRSDLFQVGGFVRHNAGPAYVSAALAYGWQDVTTNRLVMGSNLRAEFNANALSGRLEGGYRFATRWFGITPYAAGQFTSFFLPSYAEAATFGSNAFALSYGSQTVSDTRTEIGFRTDRSFALAPGLLTLRSRFAWAHDYNPDRAVAATFQALPGSSFVVNGAAQASDSALTTLSAEMKWRNGWSASATFEGEFSQVTASYAGKGVVRYAW